MPTVFFEMGKQMKKVTDIKKGVWAGTRFLTSGPVDRFQLNLT
jgi:hypothetical protein